jgi:hypothetical protein
MSIHFHNSLDKRKKRMKLATLFAAGTVVILGNLCRCGASSNVPENLIWDDIRDLKKGSTVEDVARVRRLFNTLLLDRVPMLPMVDHGKELTNETRDILSKIASDIECFFKMTPA